MFNIFSDFSIKNIPENCTFPSIHETAQISVL